MDNNDLELKEDIEVENEDENIDILEALDNSDKNKNILKNNIIGVNLLSTINNECEVKAFGFDKIM